MFEKKPAKKIWDQLTTGLIGAVAIDVLILIVFVITNHMVWDLPLFHLLSAILLLLSLIFYLVVNGMNGIPLWKKRLLFGLIVFGFLILILTSGLAIVVALL